MVLKASLFKGESGVLSGGILCRRKKAGKGQSRGGERTIDQDWFLDKVGEGRVKPQQQQMFGTPADRDRVG